MPIKYALAAGLLAVAVQSSALAEDKTETVKLRDLELTVPTGWKQTKPSSSLRLGQFEIPKAEGDSEETQLAIFTFRGGGGGVAGNLPRWLGEFKSEGRKVTLKEGKGKQGKYVIADIRGEHIGTSFRRRSKPLKDGRLVGVILTIEGKGIYFLKMVGQDKTVKAATPAFRKALGADAEAEKTYKPSI